jgi:isoquinoline 1-oxidoreductase subunit alpha
MLFKFTANGQDHEIETKPNMPLVWILRDLFGRDVVTVGCGRNTTCGACVVMLNGVKTNSCSLTAEKAQGCVVTTPGWKPATPTPGSEPAAS